MLSFVDAFKPCFDAALPPPDLSVSEWAERYAVLTAESSSEPGRWKAIPYQTAMMDACSHPSVERLTVMKSARIGYTKVLGHLIGYHVHQDPCSILVVQPTLDDAEGWSKEELQPVIEQTDVLRALIAPPRARDSGNTILRKKYPGGILHIVGANSARGFRRITVRLVLFDEIDGYPQSAGNEGDQEKLGEMRAATAWNRKVIKGSTPTEAGFSRIERAWNESSQGHYILNCPHCHAEHVRRLLRPKKQLVIRGEVVPAAHLDLDISCWRCPACEQPIDHSHHRDMIEGGRWLGEHWAWRPDQGFSFEPGFDGHVGMHIWAGYGYAPNSTPAKLAKEYLSVKDDPDRLKTFTNTVLGEPWEEPGEQVDADILMARRERFGAEVPEGVVALTAGADVQGDRIEIEVVGWGRGQESWAVDYQVLVGDPVQAEVWAELSELWSNGTWTRADGTSLRLSGLCVDAGYLPRRVYEFVRGAKDDRVWPIKGRAGAYPVIEDRTIRERRRAKRRKLGAAPELIGVDEAKAIIMRRLRVITKPGPGYAHFPHDRTDEWFYQLTGERMVTRYPRHGRPVREWVKMYTAVEALDCRVYAYAALLLSRVDLEREREPSAEQSKQATIERLARPAVRRNNFVNGWRR
jgi:phage terminase large subunit GpA-like protein